MRELLGQVRRDESGVAHIMGLSGGKDSTALAMMLQDMNPELPMNYVCTPTGDELPEMLAHWELLESVLNMRLIRLYSPDGEGGALTLNKLIARMDALPNFRQRWCTRMLKVQPCEAFMLSLALNGPAVLYVGLRADEPAREGLIWGGPTRFPLREWGWTVAHVQAYLAVNGIRIPRRTDCARCYHQRLPEWKMLAEKHPEIYQSAVEQEDTTGHTFRTPGRDQWPVNLRELLAEFKTDRPLRGDRAYRDRVAAGEAPCRVCSL